jgi:hypothetical protein
MNLAQPNMIFFLQIFDPEYVEGLYIYYRSVDGAPSPDSYNMLTVLHTGGASGFHVTGLSSYTHYEFFLIPFYKTVDGQPSNSRMVQTLEGGKRNSFTTSLNSYLCYF